MRDFIKKNWFKIGLLLALLVVVFVTYEYFIVYIPRKNTLTLQQEKDHAQENDAKLQDCIDQAQNSYENTINYYCSSDYQNGYACMPIITLRQMWNNQLNADKESCFKQFPQS